MKICINNVIRDMTPAEEAAQNELFEIGAANAAAEQTAKENLENLKASAKAKLMAGEALTEEEANVMMGG
jgi:hypothetical protein